jgi:hypothetical protein
MRLAHTVPVKCSGCYGQKPGHPHIDFESAYDGPMLDADNPRRGHIDWLVLCDECIASAAAMLPENTEVVERLREELAEARANLADADNYIDRLESAHEARPASRRAAQSQSTPKKAPKRRYEVPA